MKVCTRDDAAPLRASAAREMSRSLARASEHTVLSLITAAIAFTASKSPLLDAAKPASITSTRRRSSWRAMRSFSSRVIEAPGDCSPSRKVVSKMMTLSDMVVCSWIERWRCKCKRPAAGGHAGRCDETLKDERQPARWTPRRSSSAAERRSTHARTVARGRTALIGAGPPRRARRSRSRSGSSAGPWPCGTRRRRSPTARRRQNSANSTVGGWMLMTAIAERDRDDAR